MPSVAAGDPPVHRTRWKRSWRIIPTLYPNRHLFDRISDPKDAATLSALEEETNPRALQNKAKLFYLRRTDHFPKKPSRFLTAPFSHLSPSRFSDGTYGVYYAARECETAVAETRYHRDLFMRATRQRPQLLRMLEIVAQLDGSFHDLRGQRRRLSAVYSPNDYSASQALARPLWQAGSQGILYASVRRKEGECAAVFSPQTISHVRQERCLEYEWNGERIATVSIVQALKRD